MLVYRRFITEKVKIVEKARMSRRSPAPSQTISDTLKTALTSSLTHANTVSNTAHTPLIANDSAPLSRIIIHER